MWREEMKNKRITSKPEPKREEVLFVRIKKINKKFMLRKSIEEEQSVSKITDAIIDKMRLEDKK